METMGTFGAVWVSVVDFGVLVVANIRRPLLLDDGRFAASLLGVPASLVPLERPEGSESNLLN